MDFKLKIVLLSVLLVLQISNTSSVPLLDPIDECILTCDACFKGQTLLNCANDCIFTQAVMNDHWKLFCPFFDANTPAVKMI
ncbi:hypothetical protein GWI33_007680 [Rhynchophorus ferrugineus]|uniref:Uncharacterized protein n=1 Tax=Rhynchophorus ferrugineus TaxID=354439 RepID=A0A834IJU5_RHYFE|nr:hypothetical protein GWI33_007680 [Rhynchophorus ferrugineus]